MVNNFWRPPLSSDGRLRDPNIPETRFSDDAEGVSSHYWAKNSRDSYRSMVSFEMYQVRKLSTKRLRIRSLSGRNFERTCHQAGTIRDRQQFAHGADWRRACRGMPLWWQFRNLNREYGFICGAGRGEVRRDAVAPTLFLPSRYIYIEFFGARSNSFIL